MVRHIVLFNLTGGDSRSKSERIAEIRAEAERVGLPQIPGVLRLEILENYKAGGHDLAVYAEMADPAAEEAYQPHPAHQAFKAFIAGKVCERAVVDAVV